MSVLIVLAVLLLALAGLPLFVLIGGGAVILGMEVAHYDFETMLSLMIVEMRRLADAPSLVALPLFTLAGFLMAESRTPQRLVRLAGALFGWMPGGLAFVALVACAIFTALTGASGVTIIALGGLLLPALQRQGYPERFSLGLVTSSGSLGLLFPPSLPLIMYALVASLSLQHTGQSVPVDELFLAGIVPGILIIVLLGAWSSFIAVKRKVPRDKFNAKEARNALWGMRWEMPLPFIILGGIYGGLMTAAEAAAVTAMLVLVIEVWLYRDIRLAQLPKIAMEAMSLIGAIFLILGVALGFTNMLVELRVPNLALDWIRQYVETPLGFLLMLNVFLLIVGCLMDVFSAIVVVVPLILPIAMEFGVDPVHLGIIFLTNLEIGYTTPPVGLNLFLAAFRFKKPLTTLYAAAVPFLVVLIVALILITYIPELSLWYRR